MLCSPSPNKIIRELEAQGVTEKKLRERVKAHGMTIKGRTIFGDKEQWQALRLHDLIYGDKA